MVQLTSCGKILMESQAAYWKKMPLKVEMEDFLEEEYSPFQKRSKLDLTKERSVGTTSFGISPSQYNPLDEPSPLGLQLKKSPSFLELIQTRLSQDHAPKAVAPVKKEQKGAPVSYNGEKLKASNFPASVLRIGTWEYVSRYEGDLVVKCYFAKHKLVWEVLAGGLKKKIEIQWSDIMALKANYPEDGPGTLDVVLARPPRFFEETNPQPRKHTLWKDGSDFTNGQASIHRRHFLQCPKGLLGKHFEKLIHCDPRLYFLSRQTDMNLESPFYGPNDSIFGSPDDSKNAASPSGAQSSSSLKTQQDSLSGHSDYYARETPSPTSVRDMYAVEKNARTGTEEPNDLSNYQIKMPGLRQSMSMSDLVNHLGQCISDRRTCENSSFSKDDEEQSMKIMDEISQMLFSDSHHNTASDEKSIMSRVNSLCCLIGKDIQDLEVNNNDHENGTDIPSDDGTTGGVEFVCRDDTLGWRGEGTGSGLGFDPGFGFSFGPGPGSGSGSGAGAGASAGAGSGAGAGAGAGLGSGSGSGSGSMSRKDSVGDLLLHNLPRITSLPQFLFDISEE